jgi:hypothetical protein
VAGRVRDHTVCSTAPSASTSSGSHSSSAGLTRGSSGWTAKAPARPSVVELVERALKLRAPADGAAMESRHLRCTCRRVVVPAVGDLSPRSSCRASGGTPSDIGYPVGTRGVEPCRSLRPAAISRSAAVQRLCPSKAESPRWRDRHGKEGVAGSSPAEGFRNRAVARFSCLRSGLGDHFWATSGSGRWLESQQGAQERGLRGAAVSRWRAHTGRRLPSQPGYPVGSTPSRTASFASRIAADSGGRRAAAGVER